MNLTPVLAQTSFLVNGIGLLAGVVVVVVLLTLVIMVFSRYTKVGPNQVLIVSGNKHKLEDGTTVGFRIVKGGGTFVMPIFEKVDLLSLELLTIDVQTPEVYTSKGVPVKVDGVSIRTAAEQFLGKSQDEIRNIATQTLEGHLRAILGTMTVEEIYQNRDAFASKVQEVAAGDMANMGLGIVSFTIRDIRDTQGYLDALGKPRIAQVKRDAQIAQAEADRDAMIKSSQATQAGQEAKFAADSKIAEAQREGNTTTIARVTCPTAPNFWRWKDLPFPRLEVRTLDLEEEADEHHADEWKWQLAAAVLCGGFGLLALAVPVQFRVAAFAAAYLAGGFFPAEEVWERLQKRVLDVHFLMLAVAVGAACIGAWAEGATLLFLFSFSGALEHYALGRTQKEIRSLFRDAPKTAIAVDARGVETEVAVEKIRAGARLLIKPGAQFPVDGEIARGATAADESNLTGEAAPVEKKVGDLALAGTINLWGAVEMLATRPAAESALQKIIKLIKEAQQQKAPAQRFADKFSTYYTYAVLGLSLAMFFVWWRLFHLPAFASVAGAHSAFYRTMTLLVVSSPCALVLSIASAVLAAIAYGARHGILFRLQRDQALKKLADILGKEEV